MKKSKKKRDIFLLGGVIVVVFFSALILVRTGGPYISPDETANAFFAEHFAQTGSLRWFEPLNTTFNDMIHPRSTVSIDGWLVPGGFVGLPVLYGTLVRSFGSGFLSLITPAVAMLAVFAWYATVRQLFDRRIAVWSGVLLAIHPAWWYYTARSLMPNVPMTAFFIFGAYFLIARPFRERVGPWIRNHNDGRLKRWGETIVPQLDTVLAGLSTGTALFIRPSAAPWILLTAVTVGVFYRKHLSGFHIALFLLACMIALSPLFFVNRATYGGPLQIGYLADRPTATASVATPTEQPRAQADRAVLRGVETLGSLLFPFGIHPRAMARNALNYGLLLFWWLTILAAIGAYRLYPSERLTRKKRRLHIAYLATMGVLTAWLVTVYGSWAINDNPDPNAITIANSYVRYWLPAFVMGAPLMAVGVEWLVGRLDTKKPRMLARGTIFAFCLSLSVYGVFFASDDGLVRAAEVLDESVHIRDSVFAQTTEDALIIVDRGDKIFFPDRRVMFPLRRERTYDMMPRLVRRVPLYYYGITFPPEDMAFLNTQQLAERGLRIFRVLSFGETSLYKIEVAR